MICVTFINDAANKIFQLRLPTLVVQQSLSSAYTTLGHAIIMCKVLLGHTQQRLV